MKLKCRESNSLVLSTCYMLQSKPDINYFYYFSKLFTTFGEGMRPGRLPHGFVLSGLQNLTSSSNSYNVFV